MKENMVWYLFFFYIQAKKKIKKISLFLSLLQEKNDRAYDTNPYGFPRYSVHLTSRRTARL